jgi:hypothetical protein
MLYQRLIVDRDQIDFVIKSMLVSEKSSLFELCTTTHCIARISPLLLILIQVVWVMIALFVAKWTRFVPVLMSDDRIVKPLLYASLVLLGINTIFVLYLTLYLPNIKKITDSSAWDVYCPRVVPTMTACGILTGLMMIRSTWPVWGFLSPLILGVEALGCLFALHFVPWL